MTRLVALAFIAAATVPGIPADLPEGALFELPSDLAEGLLTQGIARLADPPLTPPVAAPLADPPPPAPPPPAKPARAAKPAAPVRARVLVDCDYGLVNDITTLPPDQAEAAVKAGLIDPHPSAVEYAATLPQNQPRR